jgi:hypothetical protein
MKPAAVTITPVHPKRSAAMGTPVQNGAQSVNGVGNGPPVLCCIRAAKAGRRAPGPPHFSKCVTVMVTEYGGPLCPISRVRTATRADVPQTESLLPAPAGTEFAERD